MRHASLKVMPFALVFVAGAVLLGLSLRKTRDPDSASSSLPPPAWMARVPLKPSFTGGLEPPEGGPVSGDALAHLLHTQASRFLELPAVRLRFRQARELRDGRRFESDVELSLLRTPEATRFALQVRRGDEAPFEYEFEWGKGEPMRFGSVSGGTWTDIDFRGWGSTLIGVGDVPVQDLAGLWSAVRTGAIRVLGNASEPGESPRLVVDLTFEPRDSGAADERVGFGASALAYLDSDSFQLRRVRVFDSDQRLVREYDDFDFGDSSGTMYLRGFRARSLVNASTTTLRFEPPEFPDI